MCHRASGCDAELRSGGRQTTQQQRRGGNLLQDVNGESSAFPSVLFEFSVTAPWVMG